MLMSYSYLVTAPVRVRSKQTPGSHSCLSSGQCTLEWSDPVRCDTRQAGTGCRGTG